METLIHPTFDADDIERSRVTREQPALHLSIVRSDVQRNNFSETSRPARFPINNEFHRTTGTTPGTARRITSHRKTITSVKAGLDSAGVVSHAALVSTRIASDARVRP